MTNIPPAPTTPEREPRSRRRGTWFVIAAAGFLLMGIGVSVATLVQADSGDDQRAVVVDDVITSAPPSTVPPIAEPTRTPSATRAETLDAETSAANADVAEVADLVADGDELSPLAARLGRRVSVIPEIVEPRPRPIGLAVSSIETSDYPVRDVGLDESGELEVPDETEIGWYRYGATAGQPGATVLAAHVSWNRTTGPFFELGNVEPGDQVTVTLDNGTERVYEVTERTMYGKSELPRERVWRNTGDETLVLITCGGDFNPNIRRYLQNIVVYAVPIA